MENSQVPDGNCQLTIHSTSSGQMQIELVKGDAGKVGPV